MNDEPRYGEGFEHFDYVNPDAPKGGLLRDHEVGSFDSFNPFIPRGVSASGIGLVFDTLTVQSYDEPFTEYGLIAEKIEWPEDRSWVVFHIDPRARFHDGQPVTAEDVAFTFELLTTQASPVYRQYYGAVESVEVLDEYRVKFSFAPGDNREMPLILGQLVVLPEHWWQGRDFTEPNLEPPLGSGPYAVEDFRPGHSVTYARVEDYWGLGPSRRSGGSTISTASATTTTATHHRGPGGLQGRGIRLPPGEHGQALGHGLRLPGPGTRPDPHGGHRTRQHSGHAGLRVQYPARDLRGSPGARGPGLRL